MQDDSEVPRNGEDETDPAEPDGDEDNVEETEYNGNDDDKLLDEVNL
jgi:hypothetical protein